MKTPKTKPQMVTLYVVGDFVTTSQQVAEGYAQARADMRQKPMAIRKAVVEMSRTKHVETRQPGEVAEPNPIAFAISKECGWFPMLVDDLTDCLITDWHFDGLDGYTRDDAQHLIPLTNEECSKITFMAGDTTKSFDLRRPLPGQSLNAKI